MSGSPATIAAIPSRSTGWSSTLRIRIRLPAFITSFANRCVKSGETRISPAWREQNGTPSFRELSTQLQFPPEDGSTTTTARQFSGRVLAFPVNPNGLGVHPVRGPPGQCLFRHREPASNTALDRRRFRLPRLGLRHE